MKSSAIAAGQSSTTHATERKSKNAFGDVIAAPRYRRWSGQSLLGLFAGIFCWIGQAHAASLDGLWVSDGFRRILEVEKTKIKAYELTAGSCLPAWEATGTANSDGSISFLQNGCQRLLSLDTATDTARLAADCCNFDFIWRRLKERPKQMDESVVNTPQTNLAIFWQTFAENYPFFPLHGVDWNQMDRAYRGQVTDATTPMELAKVFRAMTEKLYDAHVHLSAPDLKINAWGRRNPNRFSVPAGSAQGQLVMEIITKKFVPGLKHYCQNKIHFGVIEGEIGYLCINSFGGFAPGSIASEQFRAMDDALDQIFQGSATWKGLIIDVRSNGGGFGRMDRALASRLTGERYLGYTTHARVNLEGPLQFTPAQSAWVNPSTRPGYRGPVVILMGRDTVSCAENFVLTTLGRKPAITKIGENTQGVFSEVLMRKLPNGWTFGLPNQVYRTAEGKSFDGVGVPADVTVPVFTVEEIKTGRDSGLEKAVEVLRK